MADLQNREEDSDLVVTESEENLKYMWIVKQTAIRTLICFSKVYDFAKDNSGALKPGVQSVEGAVKTVVGPLYHKVHAFPNQLLKFVDRKVDDSVTKLSYYTPAVVRQAYTMVQEAPALARSMSDEVQQKGVMNTASGLARVAVTKLEPTTTKLYCKYEPVAEQYAVSIWRSLNKLPVFPQVAQIVIPTATHWSEKYNGAVKYGREKDYAIASYLPSVPTERLDKVFGSPIPTEEVTVSAS